MGLACSFGLGACGEMGLGRRTLPRSPKARERSRSDWGRVEEWGLGGERSLARQKRENGRGRIGGVWRNGVWEANAPSLAKSARTVAVGLGGCGGMAFGRRTLPRSPKARERSRSDWGGVEEWRLGGERSLARQ